MLLSGHLASLELAATKAATARETAARERDVAAKREAKDAKRRVMERNDQVRDFATDGEKLKLSAPRLPYNNDRKGALRGTGVRYLNNRVVSTPYLLAYLLTCMFTYFYRRYLDNQVVATTYLLAYF